MYNLFKRYKMNKEIKKTKVFEIVKYIIKLLNNFSIDKKEYSPNITKIQKLLYFCDAQYMVENEGKSMFENEFQAWNLGPVIPEIYNKYKLISIFEIQDMKIEEDEYKNLSEKEKEIISKIIKKYGPLTAKKLIDKTHIENGPWDKTYKKEENQKEGIFGIYCISVIPKSDIYKYYSHNKLID